MALLRKNLNQTTKTEEKQQSEFYLNLVLQTKLGTVRIPVSKANNVEITGIACDNAEQCLKRINDTGSEWGKKQLLLNKLISELVETMQSLEKGESTPLEGLWNKVSFEVTRKGETKVGTAEYADETLIEELL